MVELEDEDDDVDVEGADSSLDEGVDGEVFGVDEVECTGGVCASTRLSCAINEISQENIIPSLLLTCVSQHFTHGLE